MISGLAEGFYYLAIFVIFLCCHFEWSNSHDYFIGYLHGCLVFTCHFKDRKAFTSENLTKKHLKNIILWNSKIYLSWCRSKTFLMNTVHLICSLPNFYRASGSSAKAWAPESWIVSRETEMETRSLEPRVQTSIRTTWSDFYIHFACFSCLAVSPDHPNKYSRIS